MSAAFVPAKWYMKGRAGYTPIWFVWHTTQSPEGIAGAEANARYGQVRPDAVSAHVYVDSNSVVGAVLDGDTAYAARNPGNLRGWQMELCGYAEQTAAQWTDPASLATIDNAAAWAATRGVLHNIPAHFLSRADLLARRPGHTTHQDLTDTFGGTHWDPGPYFPRALAIQRVLAHEHAAGIGKPVASLPTVIIPKDIRRLGPTVPVKAWSDLHGRSNQWLLQDKVTNLLYYPATHFPIFTAANIGRYHYDGQFVTFLVNMMRARGFIADPRQYVIDDALWTCLMRWKQLHNLSAWDSWDHTGEWGWSSWASVLGQSVSHH